MARGGINKAVVQKARQALADMNRGFYCIVESAFLVCEC